MHIPHELAVAGWAILGTASAIAAVHVAVLTSRTYKCPEGIWMRNRQKALAGEPLTYSDVDEVLYRR